MQYKYNPVVLKETKSLKEKKLLQTVPKEKKLYKLYATSNSEYTQVCVGISIIFSPKPPRYISINTIIPK